MLICDEVTSALDVSVQASILRLLSRLQLEEKLSMFVTHNLALVRSIADRVVVVNAGHVVEAGATADLLSRPRTGRSSSTSGTCCAGTWRGAGAAVTSRPATPRRSALLDGTAILVLQDAVMAPDRMHRILLDVAGGLLGVRLPEGAGA